MELKCYTLLSLLVGREPRYRLDIEPWGEQPSALGLRCSLFYNTWPGLNDTVSLAIVKEENGTPIMWPHMLITEGRWQEPNTDLLDFSKDPSWCTEKTFCKISLGQPILLSFGLDEPTHKHCGRYACVLENATRHVLDKTIINMEHHFNFCTISEFIYYHICFE